MNWLVLGGALAAGWWVLQSAPPALAKSHFKKGHVYRLRGRVTFDSASSELAHDALESMRVNMVAAGYRDIRVLGPADASGAYTIEWTSPVIQQDADSPRQIDIPGVVHLRVDSVEQIA